MTVLEVENKYLNAIMQQLKVHVKEYNRQLCIFEGDERQEAIAINTLMKLCEALDIPVELHTGCVQAIGVHDVPTQKPVYLYDTIKMYEREETV